jgi:hypothetical protein
MTEAEIIAKEHWQWQLCKWGMVYRNTPAFGLKRGKKKMNNRQALCSKTCFWFNKGVCKYSDISSHICTKGEQEVFNLNRETRLVRAN